MPRDQATAPRHVDRVPGIFLGEFYCPPGDRLWRSENRIEGGPLVAFPGTSVLITHAGGQPIVCNPNHVVFYNQHQVYTRGLISDLGDRCVFLDISPELVLEIVAEFDPSVVDRPDQPFLFDHGPSDAQSYLLHHVIFEHLTAAERPDVLCAQEKLFELIRTLVGRVYRVRADLRRQPRPRTLASHKDAVNAAKLILSRNFREAFTLTDLARQVHVSAYHLARMFKQHSGMSIHAYLNQLRLRSSLEHITRRRLDLTELALELGYSSHSHFTDAFRRVFRAPPSFVRRTATARSLREMSKILEV